MKIIAVIGSKNSGKTRTAEGLIAALAKLGRRVAAAKHVHHEFTVDTKGKDTWRFARAGATRVASFAPSEVAVIDRTSQPAKSLKDVLGVYRNSKWDYLILEGFHHIIGQRSDVLKVLTARSLADLRRTFKGTREPIIAIAGKVVSRSKGSSFKGVPMVHSSSSLARLVEASKRRFPRLHTGGCSSGQESSRRILA